MNKDLINANTELAERLVRLCIKKNIRITTAESCTGGLISAYITSVPGSSEVFDGALVSYANRIKSEFLGVKDKVIVTKGVVSGECVDQMAGGALEMFGADIALAVSGIAGPGGGSAEKPVGTVYICVKYGDTASNKKYNFEGDRDSVRQQTAYAALSDALDLIK